MSGEDRQKAIKHFQPLIIYLETITASDFSTFAFTDDESP
jgi:hypothetical protein